jgi:RNA polymerase primary sigma factor
MINDMGILVHETAPDMIDQTLSDAAVSDDEAAEAAAAALASVDSEFGRTTDPVRMYMREMGTVELLTREGELQIAKRIEDGLNQVLSSLSVYPRSIEKLLEIFERVEREETRLTDVISGFNDADEEPAAPAAAGGPRGGGRDGRLGGETDEAATDDDDDTTATPDTGPDPEDAARRVQLLRERYAVLRSCLEQHGRDDPRSRAAMAEVSQVFLQFKLVASVFQELAEILRATIVRIRNQERIIMSAVRGAGRHAPQAFIETFPDNETNPSGSPSSSPAVSPGPPASPSWPRRCAAASASSRRWSARTCSPSARSRRSTAACPSARPRPAAPRRRWWRPTCAW